MARMACSVRMGALAVAAGCLLSSCAWVETFALKQVHARDVLGALNTPAPVHPKFWSAEDEVAEVFRQSLPDAYFDASVPNQVLTRPQVGERVRNAVVCVGNATSNDAVERCIDALLLHLGFEDPPNPATVSPSGWMRELDTVRLQENLGAAVRAAAAYERTSRGLPIDQDAPAIERGALRGIAEALSYLGRRQGEIHRDHGKPITALVLSGGAANGAFSAGAVWWLLTNLKACEDDAAAKKAACQKNGHCTAEELLAIDQGCASDRLDMVAGASTGSLLAVLAKDFFAHVPGDDRRQRALDELVRRYTCSTNGDLYCVVDKSLYDLAADQGTAKGLVRFDGIQQALDAYVKPQTFASHPEYFASTVDFRSGRSFHFSSLDPLDLPDVSAFKQAVLASLVEPAMSEPVPGVGKATGTFLDGGIRSGLPLWTPLQRGAERALVLVNNPLEPVPLQDPPANAGRIALRMLDLFTHQPIVSELHEAEEAVVLKRVGEYERCVERLASLHPSNNESQAGMSRATSTKQIQDLCAGRVWPQAPIVTPRAVVTQPGPPLVKSVPNAYQSAWLFEPVALPERIQELAPGIRWEELAQVGYQFDPRAMWNLFALGAAVAQQRCGEVDAVLGWHLPAGPGTCTDFEALERALTPIREHAEQVCWKRDNALRTCAKSP